MSRLFESIKLCEGEFFRLPYHQQRINNAFQLLFPGTDPFNLSEALLALIVPVQGVYKCRMTYSDVIHSIDLSSYQRRNVSGLKLVDIDLPVATYKSEERSGIVTAFDQRESCDDIIMVRNGLLTDTSYSNIALFDGSRWVTPASPVLCGTNRASLLDQGILVADDIPVSDLDAYSKICLFNAMVEFGEVVLPASAILR